MVVVKEEILKNESSILDFQDLNGLTRLLGWELDTKITILFHQVGRSCSKLVRYHHHDVVPSYTR